MKELEVRADGQWRYTQECFDKVFVPECRYWIGALGLAGWRVAYMFAPIRGVYGNVTWNQPAMSAMIRLSSLWTTPPWHDCRETALHEVLELLAMPLGSGAREGMADRLVEQETHALINRLQAPLWDTRRCPKKKC
jgi:hypothetical protein